jgi:alpha-glucosidase
MPVQRRRPPAIDWWRHAVIYQVYPRSFADANGDGVGDIAGIRSRLPYLANLGVDAIWISPWYLSPQRDGGYDVTDFRFIDPPFGDLADAERLIREAHALGLRVLADIVPNHVSDDHPWFRAALRTPPGSPEWALFHAVRGRGRAGEAPPNDWRSVFGGSAWDPILDPSGRPTGSWFLHLFDSSQPDLNWEHPAVRAEFEDILRFWFDRGLDGFRIDVATSLIKAPGYPDEHRALGAGAGLLEAVAGQPQWNRPEVHEVWRAWRRVADAYDPHRVFVGEVWADSPAGLAAYLRPDELHTAFNFEYMMCPWSAERLRRAIDDSMLTAGLVDAPATWVLESHDKPRVRTRFALSAAGMDVNDRTGRGQDALGERRGRAATLFMLGLPGSAYLYQGQELGLREVIELPPETRQDPAFRRTRGGDGLRDGCRVPIPWTTTGASFGFSTTGLAWLPMPPDWGDASVERQAGDPASTLSLVRSSLRIRRAEAALGAGPMGWVATGEVDVLLARRTGSAPSRDVLVAMNLGTRDAVIPGTTLLLGSDGAVRAAGGGVALPPDTAAWLRG